ncbi:MAG: hypothetical protein ACTS73_01300 [Arsenophonus sp. NEOnobi-MAG3]
MSHHFNHFKFITIDSGSTEDIDNALYIGLWHTDDDQLCLFIAIADLIN